MNNINDVKTNIQQTTEPQLDPNPEPETTKNNSETQSSDTKNFSNSENQNSSSIHLSKKLLKQQQTQQKLKEIKTNLINVLNLVGEKVATTFILAVIISGSVVVSGGILYAIFHKPIKNSLTKYEDSIPVISAEVNDIKEIIDSDKSQYLTTIFLSSDDNINTTEHYLNLQNPKDNLYKENIKKGDMLKIKDKKVISINDIYQINNIILKEEKTK